MPRITPGTVHEDERLADLWRRRPLLFPKKQPGVARPIRFSFFASMGGPSGLFRILFSMSSTGSFLKFTVGILTFISVSFIVSFAVNTYEESKSAEEQTAAAIETVFENKN